MGHFPEFPGTPTGRSVHAVAFERAQILFKERTGAAPTPEQRDEMVSIIVAEIAAGTTEVSVLSHRAAALFSSEPA